MPAIELTANDGHKLFAWRADPAGKPKGGIVVVQEAFGVNNHIKNVAEQYAKLGYVAIAPALFDRIERGIDLGYTADVFPKVMSLFPKVTNDGLLADIGAAVDALKPAGKVGVVGYCMGGRAAWLAAAHLPIAAASGYYGGGIAKLLDHAPKCPIILHFGEKDQHIPLTEVEEIKARYPNVPVYLYPAGHGFNCDERPDFDAKSAELALERTLALFAKEVG